MTSAFQVTANATDRRSARLAYLASATPDEVFNVRLHADVRLAILELERINRTKRNGKYRRSENYRYRNQIRVLEELVATIKLGVTAEGDRVAQRAFELAEHLREGHDINSIYKEDS